MEEFRFIIIGLLLCGVIIAGSKVLDIADLWIARECALLDNKPKACYALLPHGEPKK